MKFLQSDFYCTQCGNKGLPVQRLKGQEREKGHLKILYCIYCNKETNHVEIRSDQKYTYKDFKTEFEYGNFNSSGERIKSYNQLKELIEYGKIEKQKTLGDVRDSGFGKIDLDTESY